MFPNPQDALPLPRHPNLEQYKKRAKDLQKVCRGSDPQAIRDWCAGWVQSLTRLADLKITKLHVQIDLWIQQLDEFARRKMATGSGTLTNAQFVIARAHGFESWPKLAKHIAAIARANSPVSNFERAADAIVTGDLSTLHRLLRQNPELVRTRSTREHQATLLHYVSANGVENYRQQTPPNIVAIADVLLRSGADVNAAAEVYGGGSTTLGLVATSIHPELAGVQEALLQLLLDHGATLDRAVAPDYTRGLIVTACLANGRGRAAEFLAQRGAPLDLEAAAGVGRLDVVQTFWDANGNLLSKVSQSQMERALLFACEYGRNHAIDFLLQRGASLTAQADIGQTPLHCAVLGGHLDIIKLLLDQGASLETENIYGGTALGQALWCAVHGHPVADYIPVMDALLEAGAQIEDGSLAWLAQQKGVASTTRQRLAEFLKQHGATS